MLRACYVLGDPGFNSWQGYEIFLFFQNVQIISGVAVPWLRSLAAFFHHGAWVWTQDSLCGIFIGQHSIATGFSSSRGKSPNMGRCIISYQEVLNSLLKNVNHQADEAGPCNHSINGQLLRTSVLTGRLCIGALWNFCLSLNCDSWAVEGKCKVLY